MDDTFEYSGYRFSARTGGAIARAGQLAGLTDALTTGNIPLPEMTYADNYVQVRC
jgi:hypothetical protein